MSALNPYFNFYSYGREQDLYEDLVIESIKQYGFEIQYLPRTLVDVDHLYGEDRLSQFDLAVPVEVYIKSVDGFGGEGDFLSRMGLEIRDQATISIARRRWDQIRTPKLIMENGWNYQIETANTNAPSNTHSFLLETGNSNGYSISSSRPLEGDLIYFPLNDKLFEVKFVEHEPVFYQTGKLQTYDLTIELFEYSSERFNTSNTEIDNIETAFSLDLTDDRIILETGDALLLESGGYLILDLDISTYDRQANNSYIESQADAYLDFSESNPYGQY